MNDIYKDAFTQVKAGDPDFYGDATVDEMMTELGQEKHVPWFQQAYNKYVEGQRFASQIPGTRTYSGLTLGNRAQPSTLSDLQRNIDHDTRRFLTEKQREQGYKEPPVLYVPRDDIDYYMQTGQLPKALAANAAYADLTGIRVPIRQDDGSYKDAAGDVMMRDDMADYFARLRAAHAPAPAPAEQRPILIANPPPEEPAAATGPIRTGPTSTAKAKRQKQLTLI